MSKATVARKRQKSSKKSIEMRSVRDIINKIKDSYGQTDKKLAEISSACLTRDCKIKG